MEGEEEDTSGNDLHLDKGPDQTYQKARSHNSHRQGNGTNVLVVDQGHLCSSPLSGQRNTGQNKNTSINQIILWGSLFMPRMISHS